jgi:hypothetical protein
MHCVICNEFLSDFEASRIDVRTKKNLDMCNECWSYSKPNTIDNFDLATEADMIDIDNYYHIDDIE